MADFKLTYATMFNPPEELHSGFDKAVETLKKNLGKEYGMIIDGKDVFADEKFQDHSPINTDWVLAVMQKGNAKHANDAMAAARKAFPKWSRMPWQERVKLLRKAASLIEERERWRSVSGKSALRKSISGTSSRSNTDAKL